MKHLDKVKKGGEKTESIDDGWDYGNVCLKIFGLVDKKSRRGLVLDSTRD